ncbi:MAG: hypothetical protein COZ49_01125 [Candidatus Yonathbacteria bacterium CG_4_10_14_3_um_filter_47_65]|nr:MAG: hypothetical protein AUJ44_03010 [Candidatus Nomurabacteria bacterium CG1_02_47_685]PIP03954.1 MAG: hypothetical protein COX54_01505 [Candidatus Yonathbacteria bacterium CG23_combo_of_CG06-09_8_20_14_all_46_18]PIQ33239.1 MAG: hypothetical protein COW61_00270 [Candidatus Yonathbacteria bacterium CG17_big_fil_post_rev_8_21_14_2_50_46_19]PIX56569.1 MAG: hypothetical protein COZ49_01125 [Candidatus Yonathbacteria bacterium CG_4_10_14_3_um_filter_47_65]PIY57434.1 MAG: hypothetical protein CO
MSNSRLIPTQIYFAHLASPWEQSTSENTSDLIRQYTPKDPELDKISTRDIKRVQCQFNDHPRAVLNFYKPDKVFNKLVALKI